MKSFLPNDIKDQNRKIIFDIMMQEPELAKVEVTERTTMSFVTVSKIIDYFEENGIVEKNGESRDGSGGLGRKRVVYHFNPNVYSTVGIQIIGIKAAAVLINLYGEVIASYETNKRIEFSETDLSELVRGALEFFNARAKEMNSMIVGVGIGIDGAINEQKGTLLKRTQGKREEEYCYREIIERLTREIDLPVFMENDVNAATIAEFNDLERKDDELEDLFHVAAGQGIGAGLILNKKLYKGHNVGGGEMEYMCFDTEFVKNPSEVGWLESKLGLEYLEESFHYFSKSPSGMCGKDREESISYIARYLGLAISNIVCFLDISKVILSGETIAAFPKEIADKTKEYIRRYIGRDLEVTVSTKKNSTAVGAAIIALENELGKILAG